MHTIGIDEAGRGALAGPVVVAALALSPNFKLKTTGLPRLRDSKGLSRPQREVWAQYLGGHPEVHFATARVYQGGIDRINVAKASNLAASRALQRLLRELDETNHRILLDGSLYLSFEEHRGLGAQTIIKGDEKRTAIKLASIIAKVTRDRYLDSLAMRYPGYGFDAHKGYGTYEHYKAIEKYGILKIHRLTYL